MDRASARRFAWPPWTATAEEDSGLIRVNGGAHPILGRERGSTAVTFAFESDQTLDVQLKDWPSVAVSGASLAASRRWWPVADPRLHTLRAHSPPSSRSPPGSSGDVAHTGRSDLVITNSGSAFFFASAMVNFLTILSTIVGEKEQHLRHAMQMMGLMVRCANVHPNCCCPTALTPAHHVHRVPIFCVAASPAHSRPCTGSAGLPSTWSLCL